MPVTFSTIPAESIPFRLFIFDLDGTLYDQRKLRRKLYFYLLLKLLLLEVRPLDLRIIASFRKERERHKGYASPALIEEQYNWCADRLHTSVARIKRTIEKYMFTDPLRFLPGVKYPCVHDLFKWLRENGKFIAVFSDYPVDKKMRALGLVADNYFCSTDKEIGQLKPSAKALQQICTRMNCSIDETLYIGDRDDTDGESARLAGMKYLIIDPHEAAKGNYYFNLIKLFTNDYER
jgi:HAD superfamily hydrolase (TIGR01549 family)